MAPELDTSGTAGDFLKAQNLPKSGAIATIEGEGDFIPSTFKKQQFAMPVSIKGTTYTYTPKPAVIAKLVKAWGKNTKKWEGKRVRLIPQKFDKKGYAGSWTIEAEPLGK